jgi:hypothetical protein
MTFEDFANRAADEAAAAIAAGTSAEDVADSAHAEADDALIDAIAMQVALQGRKTAIALIRALCDGLETPHGR